MMANTSPGWAYPVRRCRMGRRPLCWSGTVTHRSFQVKKTPLDLDVKSISIFRVTLFLFCFGCSTSGFCDDVFTLGRFLRDGASSRSESSGGLVLVEMESLLNGKNFSMSEDMSSSEATLPLSRSSKLSFLEGPFGDLDGLGLGVHLGTWLALGELGGLSSKLSFFMAPFGELGGIRFWVHVGKWVPISNSSKFSSLICLFGELGRLGLWFHLGKWVPFVELGSKLSFCMYPLGELVFGSFGFHLGTWFPPCELGGFDSKLSLFMARFGELGGLGLGAHLGTLGPLGELVGLGVGVHLGT